MYRTVAKTFFSLSLRKCDNYRFQTLFRFVCVHFFSHSFGVSHINLFRLLLSNATAYKQRIDREKKSIEINRTWNRYNYLSSCNYNDFDSFALKRRFNISIATTAIMIWYLPSSIKCGLDEWVCVCVWRDVRRINLNKGKVIQTMALKQRQSNRLTFTLRSEPFSFVQFWKIAIFEEYQPNEMLHSLQLRIKWSVSPLWISVFFFLIGVEPFNKNDKCLENTIVSYNRAVCWRKHRWNKSAENEVQGKYNTIIQSINSRANYFFSAAY